MVSSSLSLIADILSVISAISALLLDSTITYFTQALKIDIKLGDPRHIANSHSKLAQVNLSLNKLEIAYEHANKAVKIANKTGAAVK